ncbi:PcfJ domain-containing protein [Bacteroides pyogenes]|uniref:PcfJ domain-containing protein n=1 Tax=Bacteroides pyogenes TaxID=310300 RepID=UPI002A7EFBAE|nr:PcfJ domain-containing protein [Bacteroides pyogenes]MDY4250574.1 PcfJ domain-containing protein [Bacteroides pyogenes]
MKPRNKFEKAVFAESKNLRPITKTQSKWAFRKCIDHFAYRLPKGRTTCMDCGHSWTMEKPKDTCTCPHCRARLQVRETFERKIRQKQYFTILTACGEYQVLRMFLLSVEMEKGCKATSCVIEIGQYWWNAQGRKTIIAVQRTLGRYIDTFSFCSPMAVRNDNEAYRYAAYSPIYPKLEVIDTLHRNGFKDDFHDIAPTILIPALLSDSRAETLLKAGRGEHLKYFLNNSRTFDACWQSYKVATRNDYEITDISLWCDYVDMLRRLGRDIHSPKYLCPSDLIAEHDRRHTELLTQREKEELAQKRQKAMVDEKRFKELKSKFFGISFTDGTIQVSVLESVQEYLEEGVSMHHCLFSNAYYLKEDSLILSATIKGKRIETIEVSLKTLEVVQSRGVCNKNTEYHDQIVNLVNANKRLIRQRMRQTA